MWQDEFVRILNEEFTHRKERQPTFTLRAYARHLGLSPGSLSDLMKRRKTWQVRPRRAAEILNKLTIKESSKNRLLLSMGEPPRTAKRDLETSNYDMLTNWLCVPVLCSFELPEELCATDRIASRLGVTEKEVRDVVDDLLRRGLLVKTETGAIRKPNEILEAAPALPNETLRRCHEMSLDLSKKAMTAVPREKRDFTSMTFAGNAKQIEFLRQEIRKLYESACVLLDNEEENQNVFHLAVQLFPMEFDQK